MRCITVQAATLFREPPRDPVGLGISTTESLNRQVTGGLPLLGRLPLGFERDPCLNFRGGLPR
jgi:hypothetical protein